MNASMAVNISESRWTLNPGLPAHLMAITHFVQKRTMDRLMESGRYGNLSLGYQGYISVLAERDCAPGELARRLGISKQACSKTLRELEQRGLLARRSNPEDSRSSLISLTEQGLQLLHEGSAVTAEIEHQLAEAVGNERLEHFIRMLETVCREMAIDIPFYEGLKQVGDGGPTRLNVLLFNLNDFLYQSLIDSLTNRGFPGLKSSFGQVLSLIVPDGGRIQYIAGMIGVSKQAIASVAAELESLGYITREPDPEDGRQVILRLAPLGERLISESAASVGELEAAIQAVLGDPDYRALRETAAALHAQVIGCKNQQTGSPEAIRQLSRQLLNQLGTTNARTLAHQLLAITRGES